MAVVTGGEQRMGRWITQKVKSHIKIFKLFELETQLPKVNGKKTKQ